MFKLFSWEELRGHNCSSKTNKKNTTKLALKERKVMALLNTINLNHDLLAEEPEHLFYITERAFNMPVEMG